MSTTVVIEQPNYIPWIGYFDLMRQADVWIWYDDVQYTKRDWRNRNRIAGATVDSMVWLTIPVKTRRRFEQTIREVEIDNSQPWSRRHLASLQRLYARAPFVDLVTALLSDALLAGTAALADLTITLNETICRLLGRAPMFYRSSQEPERGSGRVARLVELCRRHHATSYLSGPAARAYMEPEDFREAGIDLAYIVYAYPPYSRGSSPFIPNLSIVDALAWMGPKETAAFLDTWRGAREVIPR
jgi:hypothetical protein